jgi:general secretion pathway protein A
MLTGAPGAGKTLVVSCVMKLLASNNVQVEYVTGGDFFASDTNLLRELRSELAGSTSGLPTHIVTRTSAALFVDDCENLSAKAWGQIQLLVQNRNPDRPKTIVIVGRPEIEEVLASPELATLNREIRVGYRLHALRLTEIKNYIACRVRLVQTDTEVAPIFRDDAISAVCAYSRGNPGIINSLCEGALLKGDARGERLISARMIEEAAREHRAERTAHARTPRHHPDCNADLLKAAGVLLDLHLALHA